MTDYLLHTQRDFAPPGKANNSLWKVYNLHRTSPPQLELELLNAEKILYILPFGLFNFLSTWAHSKRFWMKI